MGELTFQLNYKKKGKKISKSSNTDIRTTAKLIRVDLSSIRTLLGFISFSCLKGRVVSQPL